MGKDTDMPEDGYAHCSEPECTRCLPVLLPPPQLLMYRQALFCYEELMMHVPQNTSYIIR